ncbi:MAG: slipin family protein [Gammaproteobacteria bacterium]
MLFIRTFIVRKHERGLLFKRGDFVGFLKPGLHRFVDPLRRIDVELFDLALPLFQHRLQDFLVKEHRAEVDQLFEVVKTGPAEVALVFFNDQVGEVLGPDRRALFWKDVIDITVDKVDIAEDFELTPRVAKALVRPGAMIMAAVFARKVPDGHVGLLFVDGELNGALQPGLHAFWKFERDVDIDFVDLRINALEVTGQEIMTRDKVGIRINLTANFRIVDALQAFKAVKLPLDFLRSEILFGLRAAVGTRTLDVLLEDKGAVDREVFDHVRDKLAEIGVEVRGIGVKDIILPGDMKEILAKVVEADKAAQANVIRRREETNATRSLLNTAKVMESNPVALRLKELEALEKVADKVGNISVFGGLDGVLNELVRIKQ